MPSKKQDSGLTIIIGKMAKPPRKGERKGRGISVDGKSSEDEDMEAAMEAEEKGEMDEGDMCPHCGQPMPEGAPKGGKPSGMEEDEGEEDDSY